MRTRAIAAALLLAVAGSAPAEEGFKVLVHRTNPTTSVTRAQLGQMFLKKVTRWPSGAVVTPVEPADEALKARFYARVTGKSAGALKAYWKQLIFSGRDVPPLERQGDKAVVEFVRGNTGAIGFVAAGTPTGDAKVISVKD
jgi:ABC-type phosphate transport system substrate-binding protein